jgi:hypothetical protein
MRQPALTSPLQALVAALPDDALRPLIVKLLQNDASMPLTAPAEDQEPSPRRATRPRRTAKPRRGRPPSGKRRGRPRKTIDPDLDAKIIARRRREAAQTRGRPRKVDRDVDPKLLARRERAKLQARAKRAAIKAAAEAEYSNGASNGNGAPRPAITPVRLWQHAEVLMPKMPWRIVARELNVNEAQSLDAHRSRSLPPGVTVNAIERFLELPAP